MFKLQKNKSLALLAVLIGITTIIMYITTAIANKAQISNEAFAKIMGVEKAAPATEQVGEVIVKYVDVDGNELASSEKLTGSIGNEYKAIRKDIATYVPYGEEPINKTGNYEKQSNEVTFVYQKEDENVEVSEENNTVTVKTFHEKNVKEYSVKIITKDQNGNLIKGMIYNVTSSDGETLRNGKVEGDTFVVGTLTIADEGSNNYKVEEDTQSYYEKLEERPIEFVVNKVWNEQNKEYEVSLDYAKDLNGVTFEINDSEIIINITNIDQKVDNIFDLKINKYISKVVVKENNKVTKEYTKNESNQNDVVKVDVAKSKVNNTKLEVTYKIVVENVGNVPGYATEIVDYLPQEFKYISGGQWIVDGNKATTTELKDILLNSGDKKELEITAEWELKESSLGLRENKVEIVEYENDLGIDDKTPDNIGTADILATIKTGEAQVPVFIILMILNLTVILIYIAKSKRK